MGLRQRHLVQAVPSGDWHHIWEMKQLKHKVSCLNIPHRQTSSHPGHIREAFCTVDVPCTPRSGQRAPSPGRLGWLHGALVGLAWLQRAGSLESNCRGRSGATGKRAGCCIESSVCCPGG